MRTILTSMAGLAAAVLPMAASAQQPSIIRFGIDGCDFVTGKLEAKCIPMFIGETIVFVFSLIGIFFIINIMYAGYQIAFGGAGIVEEGAGKQRLKWSIIGFIACACAFVILDAILSIMTEQVVAPPGQ